MNSNVTRFNHVVGNPPVGFSSKEEFWNQIKLQAELILEEAQELLDAANARDIVEVIDGSTDVWYLREYMDNLLEAVDVDTMLAEELVCNNNNQKFTTSPEYASASAQEYEIGTVYVRETNYNGVKYYTVNRNSDGKVMKLLDHEKPDLEILIGEELKNFLKEGE